MEMERCRCANEVPLSLWIMNLPHFFPRGHTAFLKLDVLEEFELKFSQTHRCMSDTATLFGVLA